jgi:hypothetical protein
MAESMMRAGDSFAPEQLHLQLLLGWTFTYVTDIVLIVCKHQNCQ